GPAIAVTGIALRLAAKQIVACLFLRRELRLAGQHRVKLRAERRYLGRGFITGDGLGHLIVRRAGAAAVDRPEMDRQRVAGSRRPRPIADLLHVARPSDREGLLSPDVFKEGAIGPL